MSLSNKPSGKEQPLAVEADPCREEATFVQQLVEEARGQLRQATFAIQPREASLLLGHVLGWNEAQILARGERPVSRDSVDRFRCLVRRRLTGEPVAYLVGEREFFGRSFWVDDRVLIPRPETEHLVEATLSQVEIMREQGRLAAGPKILDVGTGSGCLGVTLACELNQAQVLAVDRSLGALEVAARNAHRHQVEGQVGFLASDLATSLHIPSFDLVVSNPPYVDRIDASRMSPEILDFEPEMALFAAQGGLAVFRRLVQACKALTAGGRLLFEVGDGQSEAVADLMRQGCFEIVAIVDDYSGKARTVVGKRL